MASDVDICNSALNSVGASNIISLTEDSKAGRICNHRFVPVRNMVMRAHPWNCLIRRAELAQDSTGPIFEYAYSYQLPSDPYCLRVLEVENQADGIDYVIEGRKLLTDEGGIKLKYLAMVTDPNEYDSGLLEAISSCLAAEIAFSLSNSSALQAQLYQLYERKLSEARFQDATEGTPDQITARTFTDARR